MQLLEHYYELLAANNRCEVSVRLYLLTVKFMSGEQVRSARRTAPHRSTFIFLSYCFPFFNFRGWRAGNIFQDVKMTRRAMWLISPSTYRVTMRPTSIESGIPAKKGRRKFIPLDETLNFGR